MNTQRKIRLSVPQFLTLGYLGVILLGALLLLLPVATQAGESTTPLGAFFTSTSATCVTGLVVYDTGTHWTPFGQVVILTLIQIGGLGFMTIVSIIFRLLGREMGLYSSKVMMLSTAAKDRNGLRTFFAHIVFGTLAFEIIGAVLLSIRFVPQYGGRGVYLAIWHAISAFCNAGFDLMGTEGAPFVSFTGYATDPLVILTLCGLIVIGGLGFCVWADVASNRTHIRRYTLHTKLVLCTTAGLLTISTLLFLFFERNRFGADYGFGDKLLVSLFNAVTPRTAGFNTVDFAELSDSGYLLTLALMFVGGSSASTAGGVKITTVFVVLAGIMTVFRGKQDIEMGRRRLSHTLVHQALAIMISCLLIVLVATLGICAIEEYNEVATLRTVLFEAFSAMGTVGLSLGLTPTLHAASKIILMLLMYIGRVGILTIALAVGQNNTGVTSKRPLDNIYIG